MDTSNGNTLDTAEAAAILGITVQTVGWHIRQGHIRATRFGSGKRAIYVIDRAEIKRFSRERHPAHRPRKSQS